MIGADRVEVDPLLTLLKVFAEANPEMTPREIGRLGCGDASLFRRLEEGFAIRSETAEKMLTWFSRHFPPETQWPVSIPRPPTERYTPRPGPEMYRERR